MLNRVVDACQVMSWMEQCAYISASRLRGTHLLTAGMDRRVPAARTLGCAFMHSCVRKQAGTQTHRAVAMPCCSVTFAASTKVGDIIYITAQAREGPWARASLLLVHCAAG